MALPPNEFKDLLVGSDHEIHDALRKESLLSRRGLNDREAVLDVMQKAAKRFSDWVKAHPGMTGPNKQDRLADALLASPYVNTKAKKMAAKRSR